MSNSGVAAEIPSCRLVTRCQVCDDSDLRSVLFLGYLPPVNQMRPIGQRPSAQPGYPAELLLCPRCQLVQLGLVVDPRILFPPEYPYTSGTTRILRENFAELSRECFALLDLQPSDLVVDIGSNDGTLLSNFVPRQRVQGIERLMSGSALANGDRSTNDDHFAPAAAVDLVQQDIVAPEIGSSTQKG